MISGALRGKAWAGRGDQGRVRTALGHRYAHARGERAYRAFLEVVDENVDAVAVVVVRAGGPMSGRVAVRAAETMAATAAMVAAGVLAEVAAPRAAS